MCPSTFFKLGHCNDIEMRHQQDWLRAGITSRPAVKQTEIADNLSLQFRVDEGKLLIEVPMQILEQFRPKVPRRRDSPESQSSGESLNGLLLLHYPKLNCGDGYLMGLETESPRDHKGDSQHDHQDAEKHGTNAPDSHCFPPASGWRLWQLVHER